MPASKKSSSDARKGLKRKENTPSDLGEEKKNKTNNAKKLKTAKSTMPERLDKIVTNDIIKALYTKVIGSPEINIDYFDAKARHEMTEHMSLVAAELMGMDVFDGVADPNKARRYVMYGVASKVLRLTRMSELPPIVYDIAREAFQSTEHVGLREGAIAFQAVE